MNPLRALPVTSQSLSRFSLDFLRFMLGTGLLAGLLLSAAMAAPPSRSRPAGRAIQTDSEPSPKATPATGFDLPLNKEGERKAVALAAFAEGLVAEEDGDNERAFQAFRRSLASDSNNTELAVKVAFELARRGEVAEGIGLLKDAAKAAPKDMLPPLCLSQIYAKILKKPTLALKYANLALELDPGNIGPYLALVELHSDAGQTKKAEAILDRALKSESTDGDFWAQLGDVCSRLDLKADTTTDPEKLRRLNVLFQKALTCDPKNPEIMAKVADFYLETKQYEPAIPLYRKVIDTEEDANSEETLAYRDKLSQCLIGSSHRDQAIIVLEKIISDVPDRVETHALLGDLHLLDGTLDKSLECYQQVLRIDPTRAPVYLRVADLQMRIGQLDSAVATLREARQKYPGTALITYSLAVTLAQARQYPEALIVFEETINEAKTNKPGLTNASFYLAYGMAAEHSGDLERAATLLRKSIELAPGDSAQACNYLGYMWVERGIHLAEAKEVILQALAQEPKSGAYLDSLGWYYFKAADYPQAIETLLKAVAQLADPDPVVYEHLGDAYSASGDTAKALEAWKKALEIDPKNKTLPGKIEGAQKKLAPRVKSQ